MTPALPPAQPGLEPREKGPVGKGRGVMGWRTTPAGTTSPSASRIRWMKLTLRPPAPGGISQARSGTHNAARCTRGLRPCAEAGECWPAGRGSWNPDGRCEPQYYQYPPQESSLGPRPHLQGWREIELGSNNISGTLLPRWYIFIQQMSPGHQLGAGVMVVSKTDLPCPQRIKVRKKQANSHLAMAT